jgi:hypothetical protein
MLSIFVILKKMPKESDRQYVAENSPKSLKFAQKSKIRPKV